MIVVAVFTYMLASQYKERKKFHRLLWTFRMLFYAITAFMEFLVNPDILGSCVIAFKAYSRACSSMIPASSSSSSWGAPYSSSSASSTATDSSSRERRLSAKPGRSGRIE